MRIALALLVIAACSKSSAPENKDRGAQPVGGEAPMVPGNTGSSRPAEETQLGSAHFGVVAQPSKQLFANDAGVPPSDLPPDLGSDSHKGPPGKITLASKTSFDRTNLSADAVAEKIMKEHLVALGNCYRQTLARDASVKGKATLALTVKPDGTLASAKATAPDASLQTCFSQAMQTWTFPAPKNADGEATDAGFQVSLALAPE